MGQMSQPMRVVHLVSGDAWGGLEALVLDLITSDAYRSETETVLLSFNEGILTARAKAEGVRVIVVPESGISFTALRRQLKTILTTVHPDIIHTHRYKEILLGALLARKIGARHIVTIHGYEPPASSLLKARAFIGNSLCVGAALVQGASFVTVADHLRERFMIPASRCRSIRNGIRIPKRGSRSSPADSGHPAKKPVIGWVGRMVPVKGLSTLLCAVAEMSKKELMPRVLLIGDGPERGDLEMLTAELGLSERVRFEGFVRDIRPYYEQMDVFALPSLQEGIPIALLEALAAGLPVVASAVGGIPQVIGTSGAGVLVESRSPSVWAEAFSDLLHNPAKMSAMGEQARKHIEADFSIEGTAEQYLAMYQETSAA